MSYCQKSIPEVKGMTKILMAACLLVACAFSPSAVVAQEPGVITIGEGRYKIPDIEVVDQNGRKLRLYSDLIKGRVVVVSFFFTTCTLICPAQGRALAKLDEQLEGRLGQEVFFISISRDPKTDTVRSLKRWAKKFSVGPGWTLVTGEEEVIRTLLQDFASEGPGAESHSPILFIGNDKTGAWINASSFAAAERLVKLIDQIAFRRR
jgi:cytochrome oxidase Cu insertion factor (SCO1/SenC/PrrC family)